MIKTVDINLAGIIFHLDEDAYKLLTEYLKKLKAQFSLREGGDEIMADVEARIAELFHEALQNGRQVINTKDVQKVIDTMGQPEDYGTAEDDEEPSSASYSGPRRRYRQLFRNPDDKILGGVAGGLGAYFRIDPVWIRLAFIALMFGAGTGFWLYIILWVVIPEAKTTAQKLQMHGEPINISNIEKKVKEEMEGVKERLKDLGNDEHIKKGKRQLTDALEDIIEAIITLFRHVFTFLFKSIGVLLMIAGLFVLVLLFSTLMGTGVYIDGDFVSLTDASDYINALLPVDFTMTYLWIATVLSVFAPLVAIISLGIRILFGYRAMNRVVSLTSGFITVAGVIMFFILGVALARDFAADGGDRTSFALDNPSENESIVIVASDEGLPYEYDTDWRFDDNFQFIQNVALDIRPTREEHPYIELRSEARGRNRYDARRNAQNHEFNIVQSGQRVELSTYIRIPRESKFRAQELDVILFLPDGYTIYLDPSCADLLNDVQNTRNMWDYDMVDHYWIMTNEGLTCMDCKEGKYDRSNSEWKEKWEEEAQEFERRLQEMKNSTVPQAGSDRPVLPQE